MKNKEPKIYYDEKGHQKGYRVGITDDTYGVCPFCGKSYTEQDIKDGKVNFEHMFSRFAVKDAIGSKKTFSQIESDFMVAVHEHCNSASGEDLETPIRNIINNLNNPRVSLQQKDAESLFNYCIKISVFLRYLTDYENIPKGFCYNNEKIDSEHSDESDFYKDFNIRLRYVDSSSGLWWDAKISDQDLFTCKDETKYCFMAVINNVEISFYPKIFERKYVALPSFSIFLQRKEGGFSYRNSYNLPQKDRTKWYLNKTDTLMFNPRYRHHLKTLPVGSTNYFSRQKKLSEIVKLPPETQKQFMTQGDNGIVFCQGKDIYYVDDGVIKNISELPVGTEIPMVYLDGYVGSKLPKAMLNLKINGDFIVINSNLKSLKNAPQSVGGDFHCYNNKLASLDGAPQKVNEFNCSRNKLTSLDGAPQSVGAFDCSHNQLTSLDGAPQKVNEFDCSFNKLTSLDSAPQSVGAFDCSFNKLTSLDGAPQSVGAFDCSHNKLTSLQGAPHNSEIYFNCSYNQLTSLDGAPQSVVTFDCSHNQIASLDGAPQSVGTFDCSHNQIASLQGAPYDNPEIDFNCSYNQLTSLDGAPQKVATFNCSHNQITSLEYAPKKADWFDCSHNKLTSLDGAPNSPATAEKMESFHCDKNFLTSLEGAPEVINGTFDCSGNKLRSLEHAPRAVGDSFFCDHNMLTSLQHAPQSVGDRFNCAYNRLKSLEYAPKAVGGNFVCSYNKLTSLCGAPKEIGGDFYCSDKDFDVLRSLEFLPKARRYVLYQCYEKNYLIHNSEDELRVSFRKHKTEQRFKAEQRLLFAIFGKKEAFQTAAKKLKSANDIHDIKNQIVPDDQHGM